MTTNHAELCERLRQASIQCSDCGMYETSSDFDLAVSTIESQAARIQQQALEYVSLFVQCSEAQARIAELEKERDALIHDNARLLRIATAEASAASEALEASKAAEAAAIERCAKMAETVPLESFASHEYIRQTTHNRAQIVDAIRALLPKEES